MIRLGYVLLLLLVLAAPAAEAHSWYVDLRDAAGMSCGNDQDCRPVGLCVLPDRKEGLLIEGWRDRGHTLGLLRPDGSEREAAVALRRATGER